MLCFGGPQYTTYTTLGYSPKRSDGCKAGDRPRTPGLVPALMRHLHDSRTHRGLCSSHSKFSCSPQRPPVIWGHQHLLGKAEGLADTEAERQVPSTPDPLSPLPSPGPQLFSYSCLSGPLLSSCFWTKNHNLSSDEISCCLETWRWKHKNSPGNLRRSSGGDFGHLILPNLL